MKMTIMMFSLMLEEVGNIVGNNISIVANNVENLGADIKAENKIEIGAKIIYL